MIFSFSNGTKIEPFTDQIQRLIDVLEKNGSLIDKSLVFNNAQIKSNGRREQTDQYCFAL